MENMHISLQKGSLQHYLVSDNENGKWFQLLPFTGSMESLLHYPNVIHVLFTVSHLPPVCETTSSQVLGLVCVWPGGSGGKAKVECWSGGCMFRASGRCQCLIYTRLLPKRLSKSVPGCTREGAQFLQRAWTLFSCQLHFNHGLLLWLGWNCLPKAWNIKGASQV